ncbi:FtsX-like permease family protein [Spiroplasma gladiatoris]|uniref:FtsX-like permease family protein n=1 Tax=Spiroplasma gladiatoris TaxID=2143 RepID=UPI0014195CD8|nr:FtsX-like permease family protein [Spiroplasma gladiatoris]
MSIFTMIVMGMLATPLQLSLKAQSIKNNTNQWDTQMQYKFRYNPNFMDDVLYKGNPYKINYEQETVKITKQYTDGFGWFTNEAHELIDDYVNNWVEHSNKIKKVDENAALQFKADIIYNFCYYLSRGGKDYEYKVKVEPDKKNQNSKEHSYVVDDEGNTTIKFANVFKSEVFEEMALFNSSRNIQSYITNKILSIINQKEQDLNYNVFQKLYTKSAVGNVNHTYSIESYNSLLTSQKDANLNNLVIQKSTKTILEEVTKDSGEIEAFVNDLFLKSNNLKIGDTFSVSYPTKANSKISLNFRIIGIANKYSALTPSHESYLDSTNNYSQIYVDKSFFNEEVLFSNNFLGENFMLPNSASIDQDRMVKNSKYNMNSYIVSDPTINFEGMISAGITPFKAMGKHEQIDKLTNLKIMTWIFSIIGGILLFLAFFFITFVLKKEINNTRKQLGVFKSLGYKTRELTWIFSIKTFMTMFVAIIFGYILSIPFQIKAASEVYANIVIFDYQQIYTNPIFLVVLIFIIPLIFALVSYFVIYSYLNEGALDLMNNAPKQKNYKWLSIAIYITVPITLIYFAFNRLLLYFLKKKDLGFSYRMQENFISFGKGKFILIMILIGFSSFLFTIQMRALPIINNMINGAFNIYTKDTNHIYNYWRNSKLAIKDKIVVDNSSNTPKINYVDYNEAGSVEDFIEKEGKKYFNKYDQISILMEKISILRTNNKAKIDEMVLDSYKRIVPIFYNIISLTYPLDQLSDNQFENAMNNMLLNLNKILDQKTSLDEKKMAAKNLFDNVSKWSDSDNNLYHIKNKDENLNNAVKLSDVAKYICVSTETGYSDCNNVEGYRQNILKNYLGGKVNSGSWNQNGTDDDQTQVNEVDKYLNTILKSWISEFAIKDFNSNDKTNEQFIASNTVLFNSSTDLLAYGISSYVTNNQNIDIDNTNVIAIDTTGKFGNPRTIFNINDIGDNQLELLRYDNEINTNVLVSQRIAKILNLSVGDTFDLQLGREGTIGLKANIVGIVSADNMSQNIFVDYNYLLKRFGDELIPNDEQFFNKKYSINKSLEGDFDLKKLQQSQLNLENKLTTTTVLTSSGVNAKEWIGPSLDIYFKNFESILKSNNIQIPNAILEPIKTFISKFVKDADDKMVYALSASSLNMSLVVLPLLKAAINAIMAEMSNTMLMYILIDILLLVILLIVIMNIVVTDAINIITIMRSMGYKDIQVNWMVMGRYLTGSLITFFGAYGMSWLMWWIVKIVIWNKLQVLISLPILVYIPFVSFIAIGGIMLIGWLAAMWQIKKQPLTYLVN